MYIYVILLMAEILHQSIGSLSHYLQGFIHPRWCRISSINSMCKFSTLYYTLLWSLSIKNWTWKNYCISHRHPMGQGANRETKASNRSAVGLGGIVSATKIKLSAPWYWTSFAICSKKLDFMCFLNCDYCVIVIETKHLQYPTLSCSINLEPLVIVHVATTFLSWQSKKKGMSWLSISFSPDCGLHGGDLEWYRYSYHHNHGRLPLSSMCCFFYEIQSVCFPQNS